MNVCSKSVSQHEMATCTIGIVLMITREEAGTTNTLLETSVASFSAPVYNKANEGALLIYVFTFKLNKV